MKLFSRHYGTERFFIMIALCLAVLVGLSSYGGIIQHQANKQWLSETAIYTREYTWSRTGSQGEIAGMFTDTSRSAIFLLLKNDGAMTSTSAKSYQVFMKGRDEALQNNPTLTVFVYGPTGYVGLYFKDTAGFRNQVYSLIIRNDSAASDNANENTFDPNAERDQSFIDHNQIRLYLNFGASEVKVAPVMDVPNVTPLQLFMDMPASIGDDEGAANRFARSCANAQSILAEMTQAYALINQGRENLKDNSVIVPDLPHYIVNDRIDTTPNDFTTEPMWFEPSMATSTGAAGRLDNLYYDDGQAAASGNEGDGEGDNYAGVAGQGAFWTDEEGVDHKYYYLHTDYLYPGMVSIDWQGKEFSSGFISTLGLFSSEGLSAAARYGVYSNWKEKSESDYANAMLTSVKYDSWRKVDGSVVDMTKQDEGGVDAIVPNLCREYTEAVNQYLVLKKRYGTEMANMLDAENAIQALAGVMSSNDGKAVQNLWLY